MLLRYLIALAALPVAIPVVRWCILMGATLVRGPMSQCPRCWSTSTRWSVRRFADTLLPAFIVPRRCERCNYRFHSLRSVNYVRRAGINRSLMGSLQEPLAEIRSGQHAGVPLAKPAIAVACNEVVHQVAQRPRHDQERGHQGPREPQPPGDPQRRGRAR